MLLQAERYGTYMKTTIATRALWLHMPPPHFPVLAGVGTPHDRVGQKQLRRARGSAKWRQNSQDADTTHGSVAAVFHSWRRTSARL